MENSKSRLYEVIVIGLGAMGSAALYQLAKRGVKALGIDRFSPPHPFGSSHGDTRIIRQAIGEGEECMPLAFRSYEIWQEIEKEALTQLLYITGGLIIGSEKSSAVFHGKENFLRQTVAAAKKFNIDHEILDSAEIRRRFPQFNVGNHEAGYYEKKAGYLLPEKCVSTQLLLAQGFGAEIHTNEKVLGYASKSGNISITTNFGTYSSKKVILCVGPWISSLLEEEYQTYFRIYRQVMYWFATKEGIVISRNFPIFIWDFDTEENDSLYGFPPTDGVQGGMKVASEDYLITTIPDLVERHVSTAETMRMYEKYVKNRISMLTSKCLKAVACLYTVTPDAKFIIDFHPKNKDVIIASPCSGHGFKHSAAVGEVLAELAINQRSSIDISPFSFKRFLKKINTLKWDYSSSSDFNKFDKI